MTPVPQAAITTERHLALAATNWLVLKRPAIWLQAAGVLDGVELIAQAPLAEVREIAPALLRLAAAADRARTAHDTARQQAYLLLAREFGRADSGLLRPALAQAVRRAAVTAASVRLETTAVIAGRCLTPIEPGLLERRVGNPRTECPPRWQHVVDVPVAAAHTVAWLAIADLATRAPGALRPDREQAQHNAHLAAATATTQVTERLDDLARGAGIPATGHTAEAPRHHPLPLWRTVTWT